MPDSATPKLKYPKWSRHLSVNDDEIDSEHQDFLEQVGRCAHLLENGSSRQIRDEVAAMVTLLRAHFATEERIFGRTDYPKAMAHGIEHRVLLHLADHIKSMVDDSDDVIYLRLSLRYLAQAMVEHLLEADMGYKAYLIEC